MSVMRLFTKPNSSSMNSFFPYRDKSFCIKPFPDLGLIIIDDIVDVVEEDVFLAGEIVMQYTVVHPGNSGDVLDGGLLKGLLLKTGIQGLEDLLFAFFLYPFSRH